MSEPVELSFVYFPVAEGKIEGGGVAAQLVLIAINANVCKFLFVFLF